MMFILGFPKMTKNIHSGSGKVQNYILETSHFTTEDETQAMTTN